MSDNIVSLSSLSSHNFSLLFNSLIDHPGQVSVTGYTSYLRMESKPVGGIRTLANTAIVLIIEPNTQQSI